MHRPLPLNRISIRYIGGIWYVFCPKMTPVRFGELCWAHECAMWLLKWWRGEVKSTKEMEKPK
jgi:hypothetical protein